MRNPKRHVRFHIDLITGFVALMSAGALMLGPARLVSAQVIYPSWSYTGRLNTARYHMTATLLPNGKVLVAGGFGVPNYLSSAEVYDPATGTWVSTGSLNHTRAYHTATMLPNGKVLVAGGIDAGTNTLSTAELYDPVTGSWSTTGGLTRPRAFHTATLLQNGKVLVTGDGFGGTSAELYDPTTGKWRLTGSFHTPAWVSPTLLPNGKVLIEGGSACDSQENCTALKVAELYDQTTETWSSTGNLNIGRSEQIAVTLPNGKVLVVGGSGNCIADAGCSFLNSAELYDPATGTWSITGNLSYANHNSSEAIVLSNGKVLVAGGWAGTGTELYDPADGKWTITAYLNTGREPRALLLGNGKVLAVGGATDASAELYNQEASPNSNLIDAAQFFVHQHYSDFLSREPDSDGLAFWTNQISSCSGAACVEVKRINVSAAFFLSIEFQETGYLVYRIHKAAYGNLPDTPVPIRLDEFLTDTSRIGQVVVGQTGWEQVLENNKQTFTTEFVASARFTSAYPTSMSPADFVDRLYANAGVTPSSNDRAAAISEFAPAATITDTAAQARALRRVAENSALKQQEFNRAFVLMQYFGYLRRNPNDAPEATLDFQGYNFWLNKLNSFDGNFQNADMVKAFVASSEYRQRFGP